METWHVSVCRREDDRARDWSSHDRPGGRERQCALRGYVSTSQHALLSSHVLTLTDCDVSLSGSFRQARPVCVRGPAARVLRNCSSAYRRPASVQDIYTVSKTNQGNTRTMYKGCWRKPSCCLFCFPFHFVSNPPLGTSPSPPRCRPHHLASTPPPHRGASPLAAMGWGTGDEGVTAHQVRVDPSLPTATSFSHAITGPATPKVLEKGSGSTAKSPTSLQGVIYFHSVHFRINFYNVHPIRVESWSFIVHTQLHARRKTKQLHINSISQWYLIL